MIGLETIFASFFLVKSLHQRQVFKAELARLRRDFIGGPTPLYFAKRLTEFCGGAQTLWLDQMGILYMDVGQNGRPRGPQMLV